MGDATAAGAGALTMADAERAWKEISTIPTRTHEFTLYPVLLGSTMPYIYTWEREYHQPAWFKRDAYKGKGLTCKQRKARARSIRARKARRRNRH